MEDLSYAEVGRHMRERQARELDADLHGGESLDAVADRVWEALGEAMDASDGVLVLVSHGYAIQALLRRLDPERRCRRLHRQRRRGRAVAGGGRPRRAAETPSARKQGPSRRPTPRRTRMESQVITEFGKPLQRHRGADADAHGDRGAGAGRALRRLPLRRPHPRRLLRHGRRREDAAGPAAAAHAGPRGRRRGDRARPGRQPASRSAQHRARLLLDRLRPVRRLPARRGELLQRPAQPRLLGRHARRLRQPRAGPAPALPDRLWHDAAGAGGHLHVLGPHRLRRHEEGPARWARRTRC